MDGWRIPFTQEPPGVPDERNNQLTIEEIREKYFVSFSNFAKSHWDFVFERAPDKATTTTWALSCAENLQVASSLLAPAGRGMAKTKSQWDFVRRQRKVSEANCLF